MAGTIKDLGKFQWGIESTSGTPVPATSVVAVEDIVFTPEDTVEAPRIAQGLAIATPGQEYIPMRGMRFSIPDHPAFFEQLPDWFNMGLGLDAAPTGVGPYVWTHVRDITGNYAPQTRSVERRKTEGTSPLDHEWGYAFLESIRFSSTIDNAVQKSATGFARRAQASTLTAAQGAAVRTANAPRGALNGLHRRRLGFSRWHADHRQNPRLVMEIHHGTYALPGR